MNKIENLFFSFKPKKISKKWKRMETEEKEENIFVWCIASEMLFKEKRLKNTRGALLKKYWWHLIPWEFIFFFVRFLDFDNFFLFCFFIRLIDWIIRWFYHQSLKDCGAQRETDSKRERERERGNESANFKCNHPTTKLLKNIFWRTKRHLGNTIRIRKPSGIILSKQSSTLSSAFDSKIHALVMQLFL